MPSEQWAVKKNATSTAVTRWPFLVLTVIFICREHSSSGRFAKNSFGGGFSASLSGSSGVFENQDAAVVQMDFRGFPRLSLVEPVWVRLIGIPGTVKPDQIRFVIGNPFPDRLPGRFDELHGLDVERRRWWAGELDYALPEAVEPQEKFDLLGALHGPGEFHGRFATRAFEWVATPNLENQVAPQWSHVAGVLFRGCRDEEDFGGWCFRRRIGFGRTDDPVGDEGLLAAGFVGI